VKRRGKKWVDVQQSIFENIEEQTRIVAHTLGYSPHECWAMNCYEFFRDLRRSQHVINKRKKEYERWQNR